MVIRMMRVIWIELMRVRVESEPSYVSEDKVVILGKYLWGALQDHRVMDDLLGHNSEIIRKWSLI